MAEGAIGYATLPIIPSMAGFGPALAAGVSGPSLAAGKTAGASFTAGFASFLGPAVIVTAVVGAFKGLYEVGQIVDDVTDTIRIGTGAQGAALDGLVMSAQNVGNRVPATLSDIGGAITNVNQRLGYSGPLLEGFTARLLEVGRMQDAPININDLSAAITGFNVPGEQANGVLDRLYQISQATGVPVATLTSALSTQGAVLGQLGFSLTDSAALYGVLDAAGINSQAVMRATSAGIVRLAKDGEAPADAFKRVTTEIQGFVTEGNTAAALDLAGQVFGTRGAAQFVAAIQSGKLNLADLNSSVASTGDTILGVSGQTRDFDENLQVLQNNLISRLAPAGDLVFGIFNAGFGKLVDLIVGMPPIGDVFAPVLSVLQPIATIVGGALRSAFGQLWTAIGPLVPQLVQLATTASPVMIVLQALTPLLPTIAGLFGQIVGVVANLASAVLPLLIPIVTQLAGIFGDVLGAVLPIIVQLISALVPIFSSLVEAMLPVITAVLGLISPLLSLLEPLFALIGPILTPLINLLVQVIGVALQPLMLAFQQLLPPILDVVSTIVTALFPVIEAITQILGGVINFLVGVFTGNWKQAWNGIVQIFSGIFNGIVGIVRGVINTAISIINGIIGGINGVAGAVAGATGGAINLRIPRIPSLALGADVAARRGGTLALLAEAGEAETVTNLGTTNAALEATTALAERALAGGLGDQQTIVAALTAALRAVLAELGPTDLSGDTIDRLARAIAALLRLQSRQGGPVTQ